MKVIHVGMVLLGAGLTPLHALEADKDFQGVLEQYHRLDFEELDKTRRDAVLESWPGIRTMEGVKAMVDYLMTPGLSGTPRADTLALLAKSKVPRMEIVAYLLGNARQVEDDPIALVRHFAVMDSFPEDTRIIRSLAGFLDDQRVVPRPKREPFEDRGSGMAARLCDCGYGTIGRILIARKDIPKQGLGVGDPGGEYTYEGRDRQIAAMKKKLKELGLVDEAAPPAPGPEPDGKGQAQPTPAAQAAPTVTSQRGSGSTSSRPLPWGWIAASGAALVALLTWVMLRRKG